MFKKWRSDKSAKKEKGDAKAQALASSGHSSAEKAASGGVSGPVSGTPSAGTHSGPASKRGSVSGQVSGQASGQASSSLHGGTAVESGSANAASAAVPAAKLAGNGAVNGGANGGANGANGANGAKPKPSVQHVEFPEFEQEPYDPSLEYKAITNDPDRPYGDGDDKVFGMENFGYTCYQASILQALYWTEPLRKEMQSFPKRDPRKPRMRKLRVEGEKPRGFTAAVIEQREKGEVVTAALPSTNGNCGPSCEGTNGNGNGNGNTTSAGDSAAAKMKNLFIRSSDDDKDKDKDKDGNGNGNGNGSAVAAADGNETRVATDDPELERYMLTRYPALRELGVRYFENHQGNLTVVGATENANDNSEVRKRQALLRGPVINLDISYAKTYGMDPSLYTDVKDLFEAVSENQSKTGIVSDWYLNEMVKAQNEMFRGAMHQDAHEFLNFLVNNLIETSTAFEKSHPEEHSNMPQIFEGLLTSETRCLSCESVSTRDEKFLDLSIDLQQNTSITNCLKKFSQSEMLSGSNKFFCENCHSLQEAAKTIKLKSLPQILAFHLKRFKYSESLGRMVKLFYRVEYTKTLRIFNTTDDCNVQDKLYELYGVVVHIGGGPYHGHYIALVKTPKYGWLLFDDETVESIDENYVYRFFGDGPGLSAAYLLFYREVVDEEAFKDKTDFCGLTESDDPELFTDSTPDGSDGTSTAADSSPQKKKNRLTLNFMKL